MRLDPRLLRPCALPPSLTLPSTCTSAEHEGEISFFNGKLYEEFKNDPEQKW